MIFFYTGTAVFAVRKSASDNVITMWWDTKPVVCYTCAPSVVPWQYTLCHCLTVANSLLSPLYDKLVFNTMSFITFALR